MRKRQRRSITTSINNIARSTDFQKKVYRAVMEIPRGQARSYAWVARHIGHPRAYRAVGNALNVNPRPGIIPCHRIIKSDGSLGGFAWGRKAKKRLLSQEAIVV